MEVMPLPERLHGRGETQVLGTEDADAAGGVYREQTTDKRGAEQPGYKQVVRDTD
jgi:hypothetical protein